MSDKTTRVFALRQSGWLWSGGALVIAAVVLLPLLSVLWLALFPDVNVWPHLMATVLPRYVMTTLGLMLSVGALTILIGTGAAWLVVMYEFPGRRWLQWALLLPLSVPAYVGAYALVDFLEYAGPLQTGLRALMGWSSSQDYWFPQVRSLGGAILVLSFAMYPYVYLLVRAALREQSGAAYEVAQALGAGPWRRFGRIGLPLVRPAIAAGAAVVMMETVNDFGTVDYFAVQTLTTGIFTLWRQSGNLGGAAQLAALILGMVVFLLLIEKLSRRKARFYLTARGQRPVQAQALRGRLRWVAMLACVAPVLIGFVFPVAVLSSHAVHAETWVAPGFARALQHTLTLGIGAALLCVIGGLFMVYGVRLSGRVLPRTLLPVTGLGYATPGAVLGLGVLIPLAATDNWVADRVLALTGHDPGLVLTGSSAALILAFAVRFFAIAQGSADSALGRVAPSLPMAARSLGQTAGQTLRRLHVPLVRASVASAMMLVFVDSVKELPATLVLRPFGYDTLATRVHEKASLENIADAAPAALLICLVGLVAVAILARANK